VTDLFEEKSKTWDSNDRRRRLSSGIGESILKNAALTSHMHVLDFGAGTGLISSQVAPFVQKITAVDVSESMLERLRSKPELKDKVEVICQDITEKPIGIEYDLIMSAMAMHHVKDTDNLIKQFAAHLKHGGEIALADLDSEDGSFHENGSEGVFHLGFDRQELEKLLKKHGFVNVRFDDACVVQGERRSYPIFLALATKSASA
jgi:2-polyprenyl-3-methyl-5-hydroxy-6-metoxy-1,4-benzoquinol methylase